MKRLAWIAFAALALSAPAAAQFVSDAEAFISAVRGRDGDKALELLGQRPTIVNARNVKGETALIVAIARRDSTWTQFLLTRGADPNLAASNGDTPLITAARVGFLEAVEWLLKQRAKVDAANRMGETPLIIAVQQRQLPIVELLLKVGADPDKTDSAAGYSARDYAKRDTRDRQILAAIEAAKTQKKSAKPNDLKLDDFKLN
jgi:ankyrin repeat protein